MAGRPTALDEDHRFRVLRLLEENPEMSQRELAIAIGISTGSVNYLLRALVAPGFVKFGNFSASEDKRRYAYILTRRGIAERAAITGRFLARKLEEYNALKREIEALEHELDSRAIATPKRTLREGGWKM